MRRHLLLEPEGPLDDADDHHPLRTATNLTDLELPADLHLLVNGTEAPAAYDPSSGCLLTTVTPEPYVRLHGRLRQP
ncbi:MAG TPA: hypothetical protein VMT03_04880 [Polyangia bacterium]|nr:hypothetical protein [Polyangia bacterium]